MSDGTVLYLLNCRNCEDIQRLTEKLRACECGKTRGQLARGEPNVEGVYGRLFAMQFEDYDRLGPGEVACFVVTED